MDILLDTNFILECVKQKIDFIDFIVFGNVLIPSVAMKELKELTTDKRLKLADRELAKVSLDVIRACEYIKIIPLEGPLDDAIVNYIDNTEKETAVATFDRELKDRLRHKSRIISLNNKKIKLY